ALPPGALVSVRIFWPLNHIFWLVFCVLPAPAVTCRSYSTIPAEGVGAPHPVPAAASSTTATGRTRRESSGRCIGILLSDSLSGRQPLLLYALCQFVSGDSTLLSVPAADHGGAFRLRALH